MSHSETGRDIVTGGNRGIGAAVVTALAAAGRPLVFSCESSTDATQALTERVRRVGDTAIAVQGDGPDSGAVETLVETCK